MTHGEMPVMERDTSWSGVSCFVFFPEDMILADSQLLQTLLWIINEIQTVGAKRGNRIQQIMKRHLRASKGILSSHSWGNISGPQS